MIFSIGLSLLMFGLFAYVGCITLAMDNANFWLALLATLIPCFFVQSIQPKLRMKLFNLYALALLAFIVTLVATTFPLFHASAYARLFGEAIEKPLAGSLPPIDIKNAPLVSRDMAEREAEKRLSEMPGLGSQVKVGEMTKQRIGDKLYWVAFLEHSGFFKWYSNGTTPGYVKVSATDPSDVTLVTELNGKKLAMRYLRSAFFGDNVERHFYLNGYNTRYITDFSSEVDDSGKPFVVATVYEHEVGFAGQQATGVAIMDVQSGAIKYYSIAQAPAWVDRIQPESFVKDQLGDQLRYVHGAVNLSDKDRLAISGDIDMVYGADGRAYFFAGLTSVGSDKGLTGFVLIDSRTKAAVRYTLSGVVESVAEHAAEGVYPEKRYTSTDALPYMVNGTPTYVMALKDATGIARLYAMVDMTDFQKVAVADTLAATLRQYQTKLATRNSQMDSDAQVHLIKVRTQVLRSAAEVRGGNTSYTLVLASAPGKLFAVGADVAEDLSVTRPGDEVELEFAQGESRVVSVQAFKNLTLAGSPQN